MEYPASLFYFPGLHLGIHTRLDTSVCTKNIQVTSVIFHGIAREGVA